jgi:iduronate 2-sulfatase
MFKFFYIYLLSICSFSQSQNLLFIIVDDLSARIQGHYSQPGLTPLTPNILRLQSMGVTFTRAYTRVTLCSPSRTALLTGLRPEETRLWTIGPYWRNTTQKANLGEYVTLPEAFKMIGYNTTGAGKVWHPGTSSGGLPSWGLGDVGGDDQPFSWSYEIPPDVDSRLLFWECDAWLNSTGQSTKSAFIKNGTGCVTSDSCIQCLESYNATSTTIPWVVSPCPDECFVDPMISNYVSDILKTKASLSLPQPFAFFTGLKRPHLGFQIPQRFLDLYPETVPLSMIRTPSEFFPRAAWASNGEIRGYRDISPYVLENETFPGMLNDTIHSQLRRAYYASVSLMDSAVGTILDELESSGLQNNTWIVFTSDHGFQLGEHGNWAKITLHENTARIPLIIVPPTGSGSDVYNRNITIGASEGVFVSLLDVFPTLSEIFNLSSVFQNKTQLKGKSLVPFLKVNASISNNIYNTSFTQIIRGDQGVSICSTPDVDYTIQVNQNNSDKPFPSQKGLVPNCTMGLSVRVKNWRYSAWVVFNYGTADTNEKDVGPKWSLGEECYKGEELYNHTLDDLLIGESDNNFDTSELVNLAYEAEYTSVKSELRLLVQKEWPESR